MAIPKQFTIPEHGKPTDLGTSYRFKQTVQSRFLHYVAPLLSSGILPPTDYGTTIMSLYTRAFSGSKALLSHNRVLQTASAQIAPEEANLTRYFYNFVQLSVAPSIPIMRG